MPGIEFARRRLLSMSGLAVGGVAGALGLSGCSNEPATPEPSDLNRGAAALAVVAKPPEAREEWARLAEGNARYAAGNATHDRQDDPAYRRELRNGAEPFACVVGCMDARVPPELIFDVGLGDMVTVRSAGQTVDDMVQGSVEFAVAHLGVRLVLVLGHSDCAAVGAAMKRVRAETGDTGESGGGSVAPDGVSSGGHTMDAVVEQIEDAVRRTPRVEDETVYSAKCAGMQAVMAADRLLARSDVLSNAVHGRSGEPVSVLPAMYDIGTGLVQRVTESRIRRP